jgi:glycolate oxidase iron-sulfur subunit
VSAQRVAARPCAIPDTPLAAAVPGIDTCVHCGFCLQACPTYVNLQDENDSPRGRIMLMRAMVEGELAVTDPVAQEHLDRCLGCRACETACPSGVPYGQLIEAARATYVPTRPRNRLASLVLRVFGSPALLRGAMWLSRLARATRVPTLLARVSGRLGFASAMLDSTRHGLDVAPYAVTVGGGRGRVALLRGCIMEGLFTATNRATGRTLQANDYALADAPGQGCCGALHAHAGDLDEARRLARVNIAAFERAGAAAIAVNSAGCGAMMKEYGHLLHDDPAWAERARRVSATVRDVSELLAAAGPRRGGPLPLLVTYDAPCHLLHAQRVASPPLAVLGAIPGLTLVPLDDHEQCCGAAGIYSLIEPTTSDAVLAPKLRNIAATRAPIVATGNPGCLMQIGAGLMREGSATRAVHPVDLLDASYAVLAREHGGRLPAAPSPGDSKVGA